MSAVLRFDDRFVEKVGEIIDMLIGTENDVATTTAIAAIGPTFRYEFLPAETDAPALMSIQRCNASTLQRNGPRKRLVKRFRPLRDCGPAEFLLGAFACGLSEFFAQRWIGH